VVASIKRILNLNAPITDIDAQDEANHESTNASAEGAVWKVLVFDEMGRDVISSVLRVNDLRSSGVCIDFFWLWAVILRVLLGHNSLEHWHNPAYDPRRTWCSTSKKTVTKMDRSLLYT
jgi:hypothetical protein